MKRSIRARGHQWESLESRRLYSRTLADVGGLAPAEPAATRPNFVFILSDDMDVDSIRYMPKVQALIAERGVTFENAFVSNPVCSPSNVSILTGQYSYNNQNLHNVQPLGGFEKFTNMRTDGDLATQGDENTLATWLDDAGYLTGRVGKYLVGYPVGSTYIPPGWDQWLASYDGFSRYFNYQTNENGTVMQYGAAEADYLTDVMTGKSVEFIQGAEAVDDQPFFLQYAVNAPHSGVSPNGPPTPAPRHTGMFAGVAAPRTPSFNEADVSDKPSNIRNLPPLTAAQVADIDREYQARIESLQAVDEGVERIVNTLAENGELENTFIIFTSDNGYHLGQHRLRNGKAQPYEEDIRVPLVVSGPDVRAGASLDHFAVNVDIAPTIAELAQATPGRTMDGRSLAPLLVRDTPPPSNWRKDFLVEIYRAPGQPGSPGKALRTRHETYIEYADGFRELYDLRTDPYQLDNIFGSADKGHIKNLSKRLAELLAPGGDKSRNETALDPAAAAAEHAALTVRPVWDEPQDGVLR